MRRGLVLNVAVFLLLLSLMAASVMADNNLFRDITDPFADFDLGEVYDEPGRAFFIDLIIYAIIFISMAVAGLKNQFGGKKALPVVMGVVLALALSMAAQRADFRLLDQGAPFAVGIFILFLGLTLYRLIRHHNFNWKVTVLFLWFITISSAFDDKIRALGGGVGAIAMSVFTIAAVAAGVALFFSYKGGGGGLAGLGNAVRNDTTLTHERLDETQEQRDARIEENIERQELAELGKIQGIGKREIGEVSKIIKDLDKLTGVLKSGNIRNTQRYAEIKTTIGDAQPHWGELKALTNQLRGRVAELEQIEREESKVMADAIRRGVDAVIQERRNQAKQAGQKQYGKLQLEQKQTQYLNDAKARLAQKLKSERGQLETRINIVSTAETTVGNYFQQAMTAIGQNQPNLAADYLQRAKKELQEIERIIIFLSKTDLNQIRLAIVKEFDDFRQVETISKRVRRDMGQL